MNRFCISMLVTENIIIKCREIQVECLWNVKKRNQEACYDSLQ